MLTVIVDFDESGNSNTLKSLANRYSVMPSADGSFMIPAGSAMAASAKLVKPMLKVVEIRQERSRLDQ